MGLILLHQTQQQASDTRYLWLCRCQLCGAEVLRRKNNAVRSKSCGCHVPKPNLQHGMRNSKEYRAWQAIKNRCHSETNKDYGKYGACGIRVCDEWRGNFGAFFSHIGLAPSPRHQIDRINTLGNYEPGNVRWATPTEQQRNRRISYRWHIKGKTYESISEAASDHGVSQHTIHRWCDGAIDHRDGRVYKPRLDCRKEPKYA